VLAVIKLMPTDGMMVGKSRDDGGSDEG